MLLLLCYLLIYYLGKNLIFKLVWKEKTFQTPPIVAMLHVNFENLTIRLHVLIIPSILPKFKEDQ